MRITLYSSGLAAFLTLSAPAISAEREAARGESPVAAAQFSEPRCLWAGVGADVLGAPSPDRRYVSVVDPDSGDLALREVSSGRLRRLTHKNSEQDEGQFAYFSVISPDSKWVAYAWFNDEKFYELRVVAMNDSGDVAQPRVLYRNQEAGFVQPCAWSPDGTEILALFSRKDNISQIALVNADDGETKVLKSLNWIYPKKMDFSPDGRFIVYDNSAGGNSEQRDVFVLRADGRGETRLVEHPATDLFPLWTRDGSAVVFASARGGTMGAWAVPVTEGRPAASRGCCKGSWGAFCPWG